MRSVCTSITTTESSPPAIAESNLLGRCPTGEHTRDHRQCGFAGAVNLIPWAKANRYRYRLEESYKAESSSHVRGDGRWFVEVFCRNGLLYPFGGGLLLAYARPGVATRIARLPDAQLHQTDGTARVFRFPVDRLDEVAAILKPKKRKTISPEHLRALQEGRKSLSRSGANQFLTNDRDTKRENSRVTLNPAVNV